MANKYKIGEKIKRRRAYCRLALRELSEKTGVSISHLSLIENDEREPSLSCLHEICRALGLPIEHFFNEVLDYDQLDFGDKESIPLEDLVEKKWSYPEGHYKLDKIIGYYQDSLKIVRKAKFLRDYYKDLVEIGKIKDG